MEIIFVCHLEEQTENSTASTISFSIVRILTKNHFILALPSALEY